MTNFLLLEIIEQIAIKTWSSSVILWDKLVLKSGIHVLILPV